MMEALTKPTRAKVQYNLRVDPELMEWLKKAGKEYERPVNYVINQAIKNMRKEIEGAKAWNQQTTKKPRLSTARA